MTSGVALIVGSYEPARCGVADYVRRLAGSLASAGAQPVVLTADSAIPGAGHGEAPVVPVVRNWGLDQLPRLVGAVAQRRPAVAHIQYAPSSYGHSRAIALAPPLLRLIGVPTVVTVHEYGGWDFRPSIVPASLLARAAAFGEGHGLWDREALLLVTGSDRVIVTNSLHQGLLAGRIASLSSALRLIPIGPNVTPPAGDHALIRRRVRAGLGLGEGDPLVAFFGFIHPVKGIDTLLRAFALFRKSRPTARLVLVGGTESLALRGSAAEEYERAVWRLAAELGVDGATLATGYLPEAEASARLLAADLCVLPFNHGVNLKSGSLLAALSHGLPTVITRAEDPLPVLKGGEHAVVVPPRDADALARAMVEVVGDAGLRQRLRAGALALAGRFAWPAIARQHLEVYDELAYVRGHDGVLSSAG